MTGEDAFGVVDVLGDELLVGVLGSGDQVQQDVDVVDARCAAWDRDAAAHGVFDVGQDLGGVGIDAGLDAAVVV